MKRIQNLIEEKGLDVFQTIAEALSRAVSSTTSIWVVDESGRNLVLSASVGLPESFKKEAASLSLSKLSLTSQAFKTGETQMANDLLADRRFLFKKHAREMGWKSALAVPFKVQSTTKGVITILTFMEREFTDIEKQLVKNYANQISLTLEADSSRRTLTRLLDIGVKFERLIVENPKNVLQEIVKGACDVTNADCSVIYPYDPERGEFDELENVASFGLSHPPEEKPRPDGIAAFVKQKGEIILPDVSKASMKLGTFVEKEKIKAFMGIALKMGDKFIGVLYIDYRRLHQFSEEEKNLIRVFAYQASVAISNLRLYEQAAKKAETLKNLYRVSFKLVSIPAQRGNINEVLRHIAQGAKKTLQADLVDLYQYDANTDQFNLPPIQVGERIVQSAEIKVIRQDDVAYQVVRGEIIKYYRDSQNESLLTQPFKSAPPPDAPAERFTIREKIKSTAIIPLVVENKIVGVLFVNYRSPQTFLQPQREMVELFAIQSAVAIANANLYHQANKRAEALRKISTIGTSLLSLPTRENELKGILKRIVAGARTTLDADLADLYVYHQNLDDFDLPPVQIGERKIPISKKKIHRDDVVYAIVSEGEPKYFIDAQNEPALTQPFTERQDAPDKRFVFRENIESAAAVPLCVGAEVLGVLFTSYHIKQPFDQQQRGLIELFASQAAIAIRNSRLFSQRKILQDISKDITSTLNRDELLQRLLEKSLQILGCEVGSIALYSRSTNRLEFQYAIGKKRYDSVAFGEGLIGSAAELEKPVRVGDISKDHRYICHVPGTHSELDVPMMVGKKLIGVLNAESDRYNAFDEESEELAVILAGQAAVAINTANLYANLHSRLDEQIHNIEALQKVYAFTSTTSLEYIYNLIAEQATKLTPAKYVGIWLLDEKADALSLGLEYGRDVTQERKQYKLPINSKSINGHVVALGKPYNCRNVVKDHYYSKWYEDVKSELAVPLLHGGRVIGTLNVESTEADAFSGDHVRLIEALAGATVVAVQNARLYGRLDTLARIGQKVSVEFGLDSALHNILEEILGALAANYGTIRLFNRKTEELELHAYIGQIGNKKHRNIQLGKGIIGWVAEHKEPALVPDVKGDKRYVKFLRGTKSEMAVPIMLEDRMLGVINIEHPKLNAFDEHDLHMLEAIAVQVAEIVRNAQLHESMVVVTEMGLSMTSGARLKESQILHLIREKASLLMDTDNMYIALYDNVTDIVRFGLAYVNGKQIDVSKDDKWQPRKAGKGQTEEIISTKKSVLIATKSDSKNWYAQSEHQQYTEDLPISPSWLGVPMMVGEKVLGMIATYHPTEDYGYDSDDLHILQAMANQAAIALDNSRMYYDVNQKLVALVDFGQVISSGIRLQESDVLELIHEKASLLMDTDNMYIALYDDVTDIVRFGLAYVNGQQIDVSENKDWQPRKAGKGRTEEIIRTHQPILIATKFESEDWYAQPGRHEYLGGQTFASWLGVPMMVNDKVLGVIATYHPIKDYVYDSDDLRVLQSMSDQAAIALHNIRELESLQALSKLLTSESDLEKLLTKIVKIARELLNADMATVYQYDSDTDEYYLPVVIGSERQPLPSKNGVATRIIRNGKVLLAEDPLISPILGESGFIRERGVKSCAAVPLGHGGKASGILFVNYIRERHHFTRRDEIILDLFADQAATAMNMTGSLYNANQQLETVQSIISAVELHTNLPEFLQNILEGILRRINAKSGTIQLYDSRRDGLVIYAKHGDVTNRNYEYIPINVGLTGKAAKQKCAIYADDTKNFPEYVGYLSDTRSEFAVPMLIGDTLIGVLNVEDPKPFAFSPYSRQLIMRLGSQLAILIRQKMNAQEAEDKRLINQVNASMGIVTAEVAHKVGNAAGKIKFLARERFQHATNITENQKRDIQIILRNVEDMIKATDDLFKPFMAEPKAEITVAEMVRVAIGQCATPDHITVSSDVDPNLPKVFVQVTKVQSYLTELLNNAVKYAQKGILGRGLQSDTVEIIGRRGDDGYVEILFTNHGPAIAPDRWESIFRAFSSRSSQSENDQSYGLGLWGTRTAMQEQGGTAILLESNDRNTTFMVRLPPC